MSKYVERLDNGLYRIKVSGKAYESSIIPLDVIRDFEYKLCERVVFSEIDFSKRLDEAYKSKKYGNDQIFEIISSTSIEDVYGCIVDIEYDIDEEFGTVYNLYGIVKIFDSCDNGKYVLDLIEQDKEFYLSARALGTIENGESTFYEMLTLDIKTNI